MATRWRERSSVAPIGSSVTMKKATHARTRGQARLAFALLVALAAAGGVGANLAMRATGAHLAFVPGLPLKNTARAAHGQLPARARVAGAGTMTDTVASEDVQLPGSEVVRGEPSMAIDPQGAIYITGPSGIQHDTSISASPVWVSYDQGKTFTGPISSETGSVTASGTGGGDSDLAIDTSGAAYLTSLWLGNTSMSVSTDQGHTWTELPLGHLSPVDDRPWLAYDPVNDALWMDWDGGDGIHVAKALLRAATSGTAGAPPSGLLFAQDVVAVPETALSGTPAGAVLRECLCPPGTIVTDPTGGVHFAYSSQNGVSIASSADGVSWTSAYVPGTATGNALDLDHDFEQLRSDPSGNLYVVWSQAVQGGIQVFASWLPSGAADWSPPYPISVAKDAVFGTVAVVTPGVIDVAYYGTQDASGSPASAGPSTHWDLYLAQVSNVFSKPAMRTGILYPGIHTGSIDDAGIGGSADRSLGDFFSLAVGRDGMAVVATAVGNLQSGTHLHFIRQSGPIVDVVPPPAQVSSSAPASTQTQTGGGEPVSSGGAAGSGGGAQGSVLGAQDTGSGYPDGGQAGGGSTARTALPAPHNLAMATTKSDFPYWAPVAAFAIVILLGGLLLRRLSGG